MVIGVPTGACFYDRGFVFIKSRFVFLSVNVFIQDLKGTDSDFIRYSDLVSQVQHLSTRRSRGALLLRHNELDEDGGAAEPDLQRLQLQQGRWRRHLVCGFRPLWWHLWHGQGEPVTVGEGHCPRVREGKGHEGQGYSGAYNAPSRPSSSSSPPHGAQPQDEWHRRRAKVQNTTGWDEESILP